MDTHYHNSKLVIFYIIGKNLRNNYVLVDEVIHLKTEVSCDLCIRIPGINYMH